MIKINPETILLKGTKIVTVKASKRSKAHKRKVKTDDKPEKVKTPVGMSLKEFLDNPVAGFIYDPKLTDEGVIARRHDGKTYLSKVWFEHKKKDQKRLLYHEIGHDIMQTGLDEYNKYFADVLAPFRGKVEPGSPLGFVNPFGGANRPEEMIADAYMVLWNPEFYTDYKKSKIYNFLHRTAERAKAKGLPLPENIFDRLETEFAGVKIEPPKPIELPKKTLREGTGKIAHLPENIRNEILTLHKFNNSPEKIKSNIENMIDGVAEYNDDFKNQLVAKGVIKSASGKAKLNINGKELIDWAKFVELNEKKVKINLDKGEKIITIKASKRAKAHKRKVKTVDKPKVVKFDNTELHFFEDDIKKQDFESCAAFDENGEIIFSKDGEKDRVAFNDEERIMCNGTIFTHNHPIGYSFSPADIRWACQSEMKEMRVISKSGERFTMVMEDGSNFNMKLWDDKINGIQRDMNNWVHEDFSEKINNKILTIQEATDSHWDTVWRKVVKRIPELRYDWVI